MKESNTNLKGIARIMGKLSLRIIFRLSVLLVLFFVGSVELAHAQPKQFTIDSEVSYTLLESGTTQVEYGMTITNAISTVYATEYVLQLNTGQVDQVSVIDESGSILPSTVQSLNDFTSILVEFPDQVIGRDASRSFKIRFLQADIAIEYGNVLEVNIPKLSDSLTFDTYELIVNVPSKYGQASFIGPATSTESTTDQFSSYRFTSGASSGAMLLFGSEQTYLFRLKYQAENPSISIGQVQFSLPPDTPYQKVAYLDIQPRPRLLETDKDGNWIATFELAGKERIEVVASGYVTTYLSPVVGVKESNPDPVYLEPKPFWERLDLFAFPSLIQAKDQPVITRARIIYDIVIQQLSYGFTRLESANTTRLGVVGALEQPSQALCQEYTDLFISLARSNGIHAREINGFAYTTNARFRPLSLLADVLHAWPEFYDPQSKRWIPVDPTWGDTTGGVDYFSRIGLSHIVFVRRGVSSTTPYPAGVYKLPDQEGRDVLIEVGEPTPIPPDFTVRKAGILQDQAIVITNNTGTAWYDQPLTVRSSQGIEILFKENGRSFSGKDGILLDLLPYQTKELSITPKATGLSLIESGLVDLQFGGDTITYDVVAHRVPRWVYMVAGATGLAVVSGGVLVHLLGRRGTLRRQGKKSSK